MFDPSKNLFVYEHNRVWENRGWEVTGRAQVMLMPRDGVVPLVTDGARLRPRERMRVAAVTYVGL